MKRITVAMGLIVALALPAGAAAEADNADQQAAQKQCKAERGKTRATREGFRAKYRSMSRCVRSNAAEEEAEHKRAQTNAARECKAERSELGPEAFADKYGDNANKRNAYGKCVSTLARRDKADMDDDDSDDAAQFRNAAKACAAEREAMGGSAFAETHGTNANGRNAFGKCVSDRTDDD